MVIAIPLLIIYKLPGLDDKLRQQLSASVLIMLGICVAFGARSRFSPFRHLEGTALKVIRGTGVFLALFMTFLFFAA